MPFDIVISQPSMLDDARNYIAFRRFGSEGIPMKDKVEIKLSLPRQALEAAEKEVSASIKTPEQVMERILVRMLVRHRVKKAFILVGGEGTRLRPFTYEIPKPLIPIKGKTLLEHVLDLLRKYQVNEAILSVGYKRGQIKDYFGNGARFGMKITYVEEESPLGTAGPMRMAESELTDTFIMMNGDILTNLDLFAMIDQHEETGAVGTIALTTVEDPSRYGVARLKGNQILEFIEKPKKEEAPSKLINAGVYVLEPEVFNYIPKEGKSMLERDVFPKLANEGKLYGFPFAGQWFDTGTLEAYERVLSQWKGIE